MTAVITEIGDSVTAADIHGQFRGLIASGRIGAGERLPTVRQTARDLGVSQGTAARAFKLLESEGLVVTRTGAGTRVSETAAVLPGELVKDIRRLVEHARRAGADPATVQDVLRASWNDGEAG